LRECHGRLFRRKEEIDPQITEILIDERGKARTWGYKTSRSRIGTRKRIRKGTENGTIFSRVEPV